MRGHELPVLTAACKNRKQNMMPVTEGIMNNHKCAVLRDSGCGSVIVKRDLVPTEQLTGKGKSCVLVDGTIRVVPIARINLDTPVFHRMD